MIPMSKRKAPAPVHRVQIGLRLEVELLGALDRFIAELPFTPTRTETIETAIRQLLDREKGRSHGQIAKAAR